MKNLKSYITSTLIYPQGSLICPVCGKEFKTNNDTRYIIKGGYTCSWKCFLTEAKKRNDEKNAKEKEKRGIRC